SHDTFMGSCARRRRGMLDLQPRRHLCKSSEIWTRLAPRGAPWWAQERHPQSKHPGNQRACAEVWRGSHRGACPLAYLLAVLRDEGAEVERRMECAVAAAPYMHAKLKAIEVSGHEGEPIDYKVSLTFD